MQYKVSLLACYCVLLRTDCLIALFPARLVCIPNWGNLRLRLLFEGCEMYDQLCTGVESQRAVLHSLMNQIGSRSSVWCTEVLAFNRAGRPDLKGPVYKKPVN